MDGERRGERGLVDGAAGIGQRVPAKPVMDIDPSKPIEITSVLGGLHVNYRRVA